MRSAVREESYNSVRVFWLDRDYVRGELRTRAAALVAAGKAKRVVLFGSLAEGRAVPGSDADLLVVVPDDAGPMKDRIAEYLGYFSGIGIAIDIFPYREEELENPLARNALSRGIILASA